MEGIYGGFRGVRGPMGVVACPQLRLCPETPVGETDFKERKRKVPKEKERNT